MSDLLRQYERWECLSDGYPQAWHDLHTVDADGAVIWGRTAVLTARDTQTELRPAIKDLIREQAGHRCLRCGHPYRKEDPRISNGGEWSPCDADCEHGGPFQWAELVMPVGGLPHGEAPEPERYAQWRILTVHHLDEDKTNCRWWNLASLCQRCHLRMQRAVVMDRVYHFEHSEWFKPFAAGFYAFKYLGEDLAREETLARLAELLALEHRFTQEVLSF